MADKYVNYEQLASVEKEGKDYRIRYGTRASPVLIFGPHAGRIEPGTSELVTSVAREDLSFYLFEGIKSQGNNELHITSTHFDEPLALDLLMSCDKTIAFHGEKSETEQIYIGGRDIELRSLIAQSLNKAGFKTAKHSRDALQGTSKDNVCNRCRSGAGLQLEIPRGIRRLFFHSLISSGPMQKREEFHRFVDAVRAGLKRANGL